jgi:hypothetical protein
MAKRKPSKAAKACVSREIRKHCGKKRGKCRKPAARAQAVAIGFSVCRRKGFKVPGR